MPGADWEFLARGAAELGVPLNQDQLAALARYLELLCEWNQRFNLTAIDSPEEILTKHFLDSLSCARALDFGVRQTLADVGTGAGFPGMVLKIAYPHLQVTLIDAIRKRLGFLTQVASELQLTGVSVLHARAEDVARLPRPVSGAKSKPPVAEPCLRESFDVVTARAVARLNVLAEWTLPLAKVGGRVITMKGPDVNAEVDEAAQALSLLGGGPAEVQFLHLPGTEIGRSLVAVPKVKPTPKAYPRQSGVARKSPL